MMGSARFLLSSILLADHDSQLDSITATMSSMVSTAAMHTRLANWFILVPQVLTVNYSAYRLGNLSRWILGSSPLENMANRFADSLVFQSDP